MKFSLALGLLFTAGLANSELADPKQTSIDKFLRENQHLKPSATLVSIKEQGPVATVIYKDGPVSYKYDVKSDGKDMKLIGIEQVTSFSSNFQFNPSNIPKPSLQIDQLPPLPLLMPTFTIQNNGQLGMSNVFDMVQKEIKEIQQRAQRSNFNFQNQMEKRRQQIRNQITQRINQQFAKQMPLIGGDGHDFNWATEIQIQPNQPLIGGDHDLNFATIEFQNIQPLIGGDNHDLWQGEPVDIQAWHPIVGGDGHDDWENKKKKCHKKNLKKQNGLIGGDDHDDWKDGKHKGDKQMRHHSNAAWMNKKFSAQQIKPYLVEKLPDIMSESEIVSVEREGCQKGKGMKLSILIKDKSGQLQIVQAYFRPMKGEFLIEKIQKVKKDQSPLENGKKLIIDAMKNIKDGLMKPAVELQPKEKENKVQQNENLVALSQVPEQQPKQFLLGGEGDPDHDVDFIKHLNEPQVKQDNHVSEKKEEVKPEQQVLPGGSTDPDHVQEPQSPLKQALKIVEDILEEESQDVAENEEAADSQKPIEEQKRSEIKQKLELLTHRR